MKEMTGIPFIKEVKSSTRWHFIMISNYPINSSKSGLVMQESVNINVRDRTRQNISRLITSKNAFMDKFYDGTGNWPESEAKPARMCCFDRWNTGEKGTNGKIYACMEKKVIVHILLLRRSSLTWDMKKMLNEKKGPARYTPGSRFIYLRALRQYAKYGLTIFPSKWRS